MNARPLVLGILTFLLSVFQASKSLAEPKQAIAKVVSLNKSAVAAFSAGDNEKAKSQLLQAVVLGKQSGLGMHAAMARTYVHLGVVYVDGFKDKEKGQRYFGMAQKVKADVEVTPALASKSVREAFEASKAGAGKGEKVAEGEAQPEPKTDGGKAPVVADRAKAEAARERAPRPDAQDGLQKELAQAREAEKKERLERERLEKALAEKDKALVEKEKALAEAIGREKKEREAREKADKQSQENARLAAEASGREKKEREAREKAEKDRQLVETQDKERKEREEKARAAREKLAAGPDMPASIPRPLHCAPQDEAIAGAELFVHCAPQGQVKAKEMVLYYRPSGMAHFDASTMVRGAKGWWTAVVPAVRVSGKTLQFYVEARGGKDEVAASNGKADSPNIITLRTAAEGVKAAAPAEPVAKAGPPARSAKAARRTAASKKTKIRKH